MSETNDLTNLILQFLTLQRCLVWRQNQVKVPGRRFIGKKGVPDIIGMTGRGKFLGVEIKTGDDEQSAAQREFEIQTKLRGGLYFVAEDFDKFVLAWGEQLGGLH